MFSFNLKKISIASLICLFLWAPIFLSAQVEGSNQPPQQPVVKDEAAPKSSLIWICTGLFGGSGAPGECTFDDLVEATKNFVNKLTLLAIGFVVIVIAWAGF